jgi:uncharacterized membrane protein
VKETRERVLDLVFLVGVLFKGIDGLVELIGGLVLLIATPVQLLGAARALTAEELAEDPNDIIANLILHGAQHLESATVLFVAIYLLLHGIVKLAIVAALLLGTRRVYPWAIAALLLFLVFQIYELFVAPSWTVVLLTIFDAIIILLTWREWRRDRPLRQTWHSTLDWVFRRQPRTAP